MKSCWQHNPRQRPPFIELVDMLETQMKINENNSLYIKQMLENVYEIHTELPGEKC